MRKAQREKPLTFKRPNGDDHLSSGLGFGGWRTKRTRGFYVAFCNILRRYYDIDNCIVHQCSTPDLAGSLTPRRRQRGVSIYHLARTLFFCEMRMACIVSRLIFLKVHLLGQGIEKFLPDKSAPYIICPGARYDIHPTKPISSVHLAAYQLQSVKETVLEADH